MKKTYKVPIIGTVTKKHPLQGDPQNRLRVLPFEDLIPRIETEHPEEGIVLVPKWGISFVCLNYDIDEEWCEIEVEACEELHNWLTGILPQLNDIKKTKGWKLDKSKLEKKGG